MPRDELAAWLRLLLTPGLGRTTARQLLAAFGLPETIWAQAPDTWGRVVEPALAQAMAQPPEGFEDTVLAHERWLAQGGERHAITLADPRYPASLLDTADPPLVLFVHGRLDALSHAQRLAIVGSRNPTPQGALNARQFAHALGQAGVCVVSGLALGVDGAAHEGALAAGAPTIAVVGTGLDRVYPARHKALAHQIAATGALVSEYPLGTPPLPANFPQRNRIVAGLVRVMVVVETDVDGGSMITARFAGDLGKTLCAVPGRADSPSSRGCHALIRDGATLVSSVDDILTELGESRGSPALALIEDPPEFARWLPHFAGGTAHDAESLSVLADCAVAEAAVSLTMMEIRGVLTRRPDGRHERA